MRGIRPFAAGRGVTWLWVLVAVLFAMTVRAALAACADPYCGAFWNYPNCDAPGCQGPPLVAGSAFLCCCTNGASGCCQYECSRIYCTVSGPNCPDGVHGFAGQRKDGPCNEAWGQCGDPG